MPSRFGRLVAVVGALLLLVTCTDDHNPTSFSSFTAPPAPLAALTASPLAVQLIGAGNIARCDRTNDEATALLIDGYPNATVFTAGDNINGNATLTNYNNCYQPSWGRHKARTRPAVGEQDYKTANAAGFNQYFGAAGGTLGNYYYSYDIGAWHIMVLNDQISMVVGSPQELWLRAELANNTKKCTLAYWHRPRFTSSGTNNLAAVKPLWDALYAYGADVVVNAHASIYERFAPQSPTAVADPATGLREFIVGTGGLSVSNIGGTIRPNSEVRNSGAYGVLLLTLDTLNYSWQFLPIAGQVFTDAGTTACHTRIAVSSVDVSPASASVIVGASIQLTATPKDAAGTALSGRAVTWQSSNATIATVDANGLVTAKAVGGPVTITAAERAAKRHGPAHRHAEGLDRQSAHRPHRDVADGQCDDRHGRHERLGHGEGRRWAGDDHGDVGRKERHVRGHGHPDPRCVGCGAPRDGERCGERHGAVQRNPEGRERQSAHGPHGHLADERHHHCHGGRDGPRHRQGRGRPGDDHRHQRREERYRGGHGHRPGGVGSRHSCHTDDSTERHGPAHRDPEGRDR